MNIKPLHYWFFLFATTFLAYQFVQDIIRPNYNGNNEIIIYILGVAPNFLPAIGIPAIFVILIPEIMKSFSSIWITNRIHITANTISLIGLIGWEFVQITTINGRFDWNDILWTCIGAVLFQYIWILTPHKYKNTIL